MNLIKPYPRHFKIVNVNPGSNTKNLFIINGKFRAGQIKYYISKFAIKFIFTDLCLFLLAIIHDLYFLLVLICFLVIVFNVNFNGFADLEELKT